MNHAHIVEHELNDEQLRQNLTNAMHRLQSNRANTIQNHFDDFEGLRAKGNKAKQKALSSLAERLEEFERNATKNGFKVHWAKDANEACEIVHTIMIENDIDEILKGKSMASEEIGLNHYLEARGIKALETDLGEVIIQLIDEKPVHIVAPAIHKNRHQIGQIFHEKINAPLESDPEKLNAIARDYMREKFKKLKIGLGGVNFAISKEGAVWMIENEGNGRMCTTIPDVLVHICGIEKVVETIEDAATADTLLTPSATGQFIANYNNIISGPRKDGELDGPKQSHIIMLDNHRTNMLMHKDYNEALRCIRCGCCMNFCPVYDKIGGHSYQATYPGPIGVVIDPNLFGMDVNGDVLNFCSLCSRCSEVCPVQIPLAELIRKLRRDKAGQGGDNVPIGTANIKHSVLEKIAFKGFEFAGTHGVMFRIADKSAVLFGSLAHKLGGSLPVIKRWVAHKDLPEFGYDLYKEIESLEGVSCE